MESLIIISVITAGLIIYGALEFVRHTANLKSIPFRIHVNGTRGKSSVTRLIGAGLRAGGYNTITKVTGTYPRMILADGSEIGIPRKEKANILEQLKIVKFCSEKQADVLLIECMALQPNFQHITEHQMVRATHGVITNIRLDHLDVMGPGLPDVAKALSGTVPRKAKLFTAEDRILSVLEKKAARMDTELFVADKKTVSAGEMEGFTYFEHPENVALALLVCESMSVSRQVALQAMKKTIPDEGVLRKYVHRHVGHRIHFYNALAANDPESSFMIWKQIRLNEGNEKQYIIILNSRKDRKDRSEQLVHMVSECKFDYLVLTGENSLQVKQMALDADIDGAKVVPVGIKSPEAQLDDLLGLTERNAVIVAFGNMGAGGAELSKLFEEKHYIQ
ncbi:MAG TPA: poly-gamma-glutamate synthase PgsB [Chryseosolibacter sp.]